MWGFSGSGVGEKCVCESKDRGSKQAKKHITRKIGGYRVSSAEVSKQVKKHITRQIGGYSVSSAEKLTGKAITAIKRRETRSHCK